MSLQDKINYSIQLIQKTEKLALQMNPEGFYLAFSGGKDSQVIYELAKMSGVKFKAYMNMTTIDPPEVLRFIREKYPDVTLVRPEKSFFKWIETKQLPTRKIRWCCEKLKEVGGINHVVITGIRKAESPKRAKRKELEDHHNCKYDKFMLNPIMEWKDIDVWNFLRNNIGYWCKMYDRGYKRIGCIGCPFTSHRNKIRDFNDNPKFKRPIILSIQTFGYGTFTACAKMPVGVGLWSAFWLYDNCNPEIDFEMYSMSGNYRKCFLRPYSVETCLHTEPEYELKRFPARAPLFSHFNHDPSAGFHEYTIRWKSNLLEWYIDGVRVRRLKDEKTLRYLQDRKMTAILNTYIDGRFQERFRIDSPMEVRYFIHEKI